MVVSDRNNVADDSYSMRFLTKNGVEGSMQQSAGAWGAPASLCRCAGTKGTVWIEGGKVMLADRNGTRELPVPSDLLLPPAADPASSERMSHFEMGPFIRLCEALMARITRAETAGRVAPPTFADGLATMKVMDAMRVSAAAGGALQVI